MANGITGVSVVVPVFNRAALLPALVSRLQAALQPLGLPFELILVDDGSRDDSWLAIQTLASDYAWVAGLRMAENSGQHVATLSGLRTACHPVAITMDDDLQHPPEAIPLLLAALQDADIVYAGPQGILKSRLYSTLSQSAKWAIALAAGAPFLRHVRSFRALRMACYPWRELAICKGMSLDSLMVGRRLKIHPIQVTYGVNAGASNYTLLSSARLAARLFRNALLSRKPPTGPRAEIAETAGWLSVPGAGAS